MGNFIKSFAKGLRFAVLRLAVLRLAVLRPHLLFSQIMNYIMHTILNDLESDLMIGSSNWNGIVKGQLLGEKRIRKKERIKNACLNDIKARAVWRSTADTDADQILWVLFQCQTATRYTHSSTNIRGGERKMSDFI